MKQKAKEVKQRLENSEFDEDYKRKNRERQKRYHTKKFNKILQGLGPMTV